MNRVYRRPGYYEIAFSFRDIPTEGVDFMEQCIASYSRIPVRSIFEIGCGNSPHVTEILRRGYRYGGIDLSPEMIDYSRAKAVSAGKRAQILHQNMVDFNLKEQVDFVYVALASLFVTDTAELISHFSSHRYPGHFVPAGCIYSIGVFTSALRLIFRNRGRWSKTGSKSKLK
jgi:SAM-dependent methyltransferase